MAVTVVTGAGSGIGRATALRFARNGFEVVVADINEQTGKETVDLIQDAGGRAVFRRLDVADLTDWEDFTDRVCAEHGVPDVVVNNAFAPYRFDPDNRVRFWETPWSAYKRQFDRAVKAAYTVCRAMLPLLQRRSGASIVNLASDLVSRPSIPYHDYTTAKAALAASTISSSVASSLP